jgi:tetrahydromethanopterin S-methyltransferase subunit E
VPPSALPKSANFNISFEGIVCRAFSITFCVLSIAFLAPAVFAEYYPEPFIDRFD